MLASTVLAAALATVEVLHGLLGRLALAGVRTLAELGEHVQA